MTNTTPDIQAQVHALRLRAASDPRTKALATALACPYCKGRGAFPEITGEFRECFECVHRNAAGFKTGTINTFWLPPGAVAGAIKFNMPKGWRLVIFCEYCILLERLDDMDFPYLIAEYNYKDYSNPDEPFIAAAKRCLAELGITQPEAQR